MSPQAEGRDSRESERPRELVDLHSHLVPGVDDGARSLDEGVETARRMSETGFRGAVTTPHFNASLTRDPSAMRGRLGTLETAWEDLREAVEESLPVFDLRLGMEVMLDIPDADFSDERLRMAGTSFILVEWPRLRLPPGTTEVLERLRFSGLRPVVAHPERYSGLDRGLRPVEAWREMGVHLQVNYGSLLGRYGAGARTVAFRLLRRGWVDYLATDHHGSPEAPLHVLEAWKRLGAMDGEEQLRLLSVTNPSRLLRDEEPLPAPALEGGGGFWERVKELFH